MPLLALMRLWPSFCDWSIAIMALLQILLVSFSLRLVGFFFANREDSLPRR